LACLWAACAPVYNGRGPDGGGPPPPADAGGGTGDGGGLPGSDAGAVPGGDAAPPPPGTDAATPPPPPGTDAALPAFCGNGVVDPGEPCDDGNNGVQTDACLDGCIAAFCGDGYVRSGLEVCDDGLANSNFVPDACRTSCVPASCGDSVVDTGEGCDDGNTSSGDGCSATCVVEAPSTCAGTVFGPDAYGYSGCAETPAVLPCDNISATGTSVGASLGDDGTLAVALPFTFDLYGLASASATIASNGKVGFPSDYTYFNECLPGTSPGTDNTIFAWWDDLYPPLGSVYWQVLGTAPSRRLVVQWVVPHFSSSPSTIDVRAMLFEGSNDVTVCYADTSFGTTDDNGASATAGIHGTGASYLSYSCNMPVLTTGLVLRYDHP